MKRGDLRYCPQFIAGMKWEFAGAFMFLLIQKGSDLF